MGLYMILAIQNINLQVKQKEWKVAHELQKENLTTCQESAQERNTGEPRAFQINLVSYRGILLAPSLRIWTYGSKGCQKSNLTSK